MSQDRWGGARSPRDRTGVVGQQLAARAAADKKAAKLTDDDLVLIKHEARSQGHKAGITEGHLAGFNAALNLIADAGLVTEDQVLAVTNAPEDVA